MPSIWLLQLTRSLKKTPSAQESLTNLKKKLSELENPSHDSWYWQMDKNSKEYKDYAPG